MERISVSSSLKDIPIPRRETYEKLFIAMLNSFFRRVRWKIFHADKKNKEDPNGRIQEMKNKFRSKRNPPFNPDLEQFEKDLIAIIKSSHNIMCHIH